MWFGFRVVSFAMLAAYSIPCLIVVIVTHVIGMVFLIWHNYDDDHASVLKGLVTGMHMFCYTDWDKLKCFDFFYNTIASYESAFSIGLFLIDPTMNVTNGVIMLTVFYLGVGVIFVFKFTKASSLIPLPETCQWNAVWPFNTASDTTSDTDIRH